MSIKFVGRQAPLFLAVLFIDIWI